MSPKISSLVELFEKVIWFPLMTDNWFTEWLFVTLWDETEFWDNGDVLTLVEDRDCGDVMLDVIVAVTADEEVVTDGGKSVVNEELFDDLFGTLSSLPVMALLSWPISWVDLQTPEEGVVTEEELNTELQLRLVSRSEVSSEPQKALLADWDNGVELKSIEESLS